MLPIYVQIPGAPFAQQGAFTLIELLVVIALIAVLASLSLSALQGGRERSAIARTRSELQVLTQGLEEYRQVFGDYPQTGDFRLASAERSAPLQASDAQAKWFNALLGVFGPTGFSGADRLNAKPCVEVSRLLLENEPDAGFLQVSGEPPVKTEVTNTFLDPWGRRYLYFYKSASHPEAWRAQSYVLCSAGPDGRLVEPDLATGLMSDGAKRDPANADNIYGSRVALP